MKYLFVVNHFVPFPQSEYGGLWVVRAEDKEECFEALGELEQSIDAMRESGDAIEAFLKDSPPVCMGCGSIGDEHVCPACGAERLILDPSARSEDERRIQMM